MTKPTPADTHAAEMRAQLLHRREHRRQEKDMLLQLKTAERIAEIDEELMLIEEDLKRYGHEEPKPI